MKVAFQGEHGAYSEVALYEHFGNDVEAVGCDAFDDVFELVNNGEVTYGFIPVENTIAGTVVENYDLLFANEVFVVAEAYLPVRHTLLAKKGARIEDIKEAFSHPHALRQCKAFLKKKNFMTLLWKKETMQIKENPLFRKTIGHWYDSPIASFILIICMDLVFMFSASGVVIARDIPEYQGHIWLPLLLMLLSGYVMLSVFIRIIWRVFHEHPEKKLDQ